MRLVLRILGGWLVIAAVIAAVYDITQARLGVWQMLSLGQHWSALSPDSLSQTQAMIERGLHPAVWSLVTALLSIPAWLFFALLGAVVYAIARPRNRVNIFAN